MSYKTKPASLECIKRLAKSIKTELGIKHTKALEIAAKTKGFENFRHARNVLASSSKTSPDQYTVNISVYWQDRETGQRGVESIQIPLSTLKLETLRPDHFDSSRALHDLRLSGKFNLVNHYYTPSQRAARSKACGASRALQFMDATGLRPSMAFKRAFPGRISVDDVPGRDHPSVWFDPENRRYLMTDEPYEANVQKYTDSRVKWAKENDIAIEKPSWPGMYYPDGGCRLYLLSHMTKGIPLDPVLASLNKLPKPLLDTRWRGTSEIFR